MAALLVGLSVMAVLMTVAMPVWKQLAQREKEEELVFRGQQYARAVGLFQRRAGPGVLAPSVDALVEQKVLRKKYKDPITGEDFDVVRGTVGTAQPGQTAPPGRGQAPPPGAAAPSGTGGAAVIGGAGGVGGVMGVVSKSKAESIRVYNGKNHYNEWLFVYTPPVTAPGAGAAGTGAPGQRGGPPGNPGGAIGNPGGRGPGGAPGGGPGRGPFVPGMPNPQFPGPGGPGPGRR